MPDQYMSRFGHFSKDGSSYTIDNPATPHGWVQYIHNNEFLACVDSKAVGQSFYKRPNGVRSNLILHGGTPRRVYVRDQQTGKSFAVPSVRGCKFSLTPGSAEYVAASGGLRVRWTLSVPQGLRGEAWQISVRNTGKSPRKILLAAMFPMTPHGYATKFGYDGSIRLDYHENLHAITFDIQDPDRPDPWYNTYMMQDAAVQSFDTSSATFIGDGSVDAPAALREGRLGNRLNISASEHAHKISALASEHEIPGKGEIVVTVLSGVAPEADEVARIRSAWLGSPDIVADATKAARKYYRDVARNVQVRTDDPIFDRLVNHWLGYNLLFTARWTRLYSRGFRDCMQDTQGVVSLDAKIAHVIILEAMPHVYRSGRCRRSWAAGSGALSDEYYADQSIWVAPTLKAYLAETGDTSILDEVRPWFDGGEATVWEHLVACQRHMYEDRGEHGLCLIHDGDWCDSAHRLGSKGRGEGIWLSIAYHKSLMDCIEIADWLGKTAEAVDARKWADEIRQAINQHGWDGEWFAIAYNDDGRLIGTHKDEEGRIFLNPQSWAVIADCTTPERKAQALKTIDEKLDSWVGPHLLYPPFTKGDASIGSITGFHPGTSENGSCYCHAASFKIVADCIAGRGAKAYETFRRIMPGGDADRQAPQPTCPPFAFTNSRVAAYHPHDAGKHGGTWVTGTISWCFQAATQYMLGVRPTFNGLLVDPCIPPQWTEFGVERIYRGASYCIRVLNPHGVEKGVRQITVDGKRIDGNVLPIFNGGEHNVEVVMGASLYRRLGHGRRRAIQTGAAQRPS